MDIRILTLEAVAVRIALSVFLGGIVGLEREMKNRAAGLRTYMLVCMGSCLIMMTNQYVTQVFGTGDPVRMGAQVVSGVGFLGAGTIVVTRRNQIRGLTTAAGLWASAAAGLAIGIGFYEAALLGGGAIFAVLTVMQRWDSRMHRNAKVIEVYVELNHSTSLGSFIRSLRQLELEVSNTQIEPDNALGEESRAFIMTLKSPRKKNHPELCQTIRALEGVVYLEEL